MQTVEDGNDLEAISRAIRGAREETTRPSLISVRTHIGYGSPHKQDTFEAHGSPLGPDEVIATKKNLGWPLEPKFYIPEEARTQFRKALDRGERLEGEWNAKLESYGKAYPELFREWNERMSLEAPRGLEQGHSRVSPGPKGNRHSRCRGQSHELPSRPIFLPSSEGRVT